MIPCIIAMRNDSGWAPYAFGNIDVAYKEWEPYETTWSLDDRIGAVRALDVNLLGSPRLIAVRNATVKSRRSARGRVADIELEPGHVLNRTVRQNYELYVSLIDEAITDYLTKGTAKENIA